MSETKHLTPGFFWKLLGYKGGSINISEKGITLHKNNKKYFIENHSFVKKSQIKERLFGFDLVFKTTEGQIKFGPLSRNIAKDAYQWLQCYWYLEIFSEINTAFKKIQRELTKKYIRSSEWPSIINEAQIALNRFIEPPSKGLLDDAKSRPFERISAYAKMGKNDLQKYRKKYIEHQKNIFSNYFDSIEAYPLTEDQVDACIIDEDNNLVLAGAGTGKTSTMVGRAGFLLNSNQAQPKDILMLAFANKASKEMQERMQERIKRDDLSISTFHKLGIKIISDVEGAKPSLSKYAEDHETKDSVFKRDVNLWVNEFLKDDAYKDKVIKYFEDYLFIEKSPFSFESQGEYFSYVEAEEIRTFKGEKVKGYGERIVANFLFKMGIEYEYEASYQYKTKSMDFRQYKPDFYLPEYDAYIEHFGTDKNGNTAPYIDKEKYHQGMEWKRKIHENHKTVLIETFFHEHIDGSLRTKLTKKLKDAGIECKPIPNDAVIETLRENKELTEFAILMSKIIKRYKANWFDQKKLNSKINASPHKKHLNIALELMMPLKDRYDKILIEQDDIDFDDMIGKALEYVLNGRFKPQWKYIMVDEFQDISDPRARLVKALKDKAADCSLFCVGDDWQAIYRFAGSDISFTTGFTNYFGVTQFTKLKKTFRFNSSIADISSEFVLKNPFQTKKTITTLEKVKAPSISLLRQTNKVIPGNNEKFNKIISKLSKYPDSSDSAYLLGRYLQVNKVLKAIIKLNNKASVLIQGRYNFTLPSLSEMELHREKFPTLNLIKNTVHSSKGKEADYVIVLELQSGKHGFPSEKTTNPLLDALLPTPEDFEFAEERRLFYVAITRAKKRSYLIADMSSSSAFVNELIKDNYDIDLNEFDITEDQKITQNFYCLKCQTGIMQPKINQKNKSKFYGCSHYSLCDHTENGCIECGSLMTRISENNNSYKVCSNCNKHWIPLCIKCSGEMYYKSGAYGLFWGCKNYSPNEKELSCKYTTNKIKTPRGFEDVKIETSSIKKESIIQDTSLNNEVLNDKKFTVRTDAYAYAKKLAMSKKSTVNVVEKEGYWLVELKKSEKQ
nr:UvrD-helicase domain-containing protein [Pelagibacteraceae bacterium]